MSDPSDDDLPEQVEWLLHGYQRRIDETHAAGAAVDAQMGYVGREMRWNFTLIGAASMALCLSGLHYLYGPWWWTPLALAPASTTIIVCMVRSMRRWTRYKRLMRSDSNTNC